MLFRTGLMASAAIFAFAGNAAFADAHTEMNADTVVASVDGSDITLGQLIMLRSQLPPQYQELPDETVFKGLVDQLVNQQLLANSLTEEPQRVEIAITNERRSLRAGEVVNSITELPVSDEDLQLAYDARFADVEPATEYNASHILVATQEEAAEIKAAIDGGADFAETAMEESTGPSGPNGGNLGWFGEGMMVAPFEAAVKELEPGEVSDPVETQFGWHIVKLNETRQTELPTLESLREELTSDIHQLALNARLEELTEAAEITVPEDGEFDYSIIQNLDLIED